MKVGAVQQGGVVQGVYRVQVVIREWKVWAHRAPGVDTLEQQVAPSIVRVVQDCIAASSLQELYPRQLPTLLYPYTPLGYLTYRGWATPVGEVLVVGVYRYSSIGMWVYLVSYPYYPGFPYLSMQAYPTTSTLQGWVSYPGQQEGRVVTSRDSRVGWFLRILWFPLVPILQRLIPRGTTCTSLPYGVTLHTYQYQGSTIHIYSIHW